MNTGSFIAPTKTKDVYEDLAKGVEKRFDTSDFEFNKKAKETKKCVIK